jgi:WhiB family redox-sensing transcriptional regulator
MQEVNMAEAWREAANCIGEDPAIFFPEKADGGDNRPAKLICKECIVQDECLDYALANNESHGIWGGVGERQRQRLRRVARLAVTERSIPYDDGARV